MKLILPILLLSISVAFSQSTDAHNINFIYKELMPYEKSGKHFELVLNNQQIVYVSQVIELGSLSLTVNVLNNRMMGQARSFESLVEMEIENKYPKLLREINLVDIYAVKELSEFSVLTQLPYSPRTLMIVVPITLLLVKFISSMMLG